MDIGFTAQHTLNTTQLLAFVGGNGNGSVITWYDQGPHGNDLTQSTVGFAPLIVINGELVMSQGTLALQFNGIPGTSTYTSLALPSESGVVGYVSGVLSRNTNSGSSGYLLSDTTTFYWAGSNYQLLANSWCASDVCKGNSIGWFNNQSYSPAYLLPVPSLVNNAIYSVQTSTNSSNTLWNNIGNDRGTDNQFNGYYLELIVWSQFISTASQVILYNWQAPHYLTCATDYDCSLGGVCTSGYCVCDAWWIGPHCEFLHLQLATRVNGFNQVVNTTTWRSETSGNINNTWGLSVSYNSTAGYYWGMVAYLINHTTLPTYTTHSAVAYVTASNALGPYTNMATDIIVPPFAHNPRVIQYIDGTWLLYLINGDNTGFVIYSAPCSSCAWTPLENAGTIIQFVGSAEYWFNRGSANPAPLVLSNGTMLVYFTAAGDSTNAPNSQDHNCVGVAQSTSSTWQGPYTVLDQKHCVTTPDCADPFVFRDQRGNYHMLMSTNTDHWMTMDFPALLGLYIGHAWSPDGITWSPQYLGSVTTTVYFTDGTSLDFAFRERPYIYMNGTTPIVLTNGVQVPDGTASSFSFAQSICQTAEVTSACYGGAFL